MGGGKYCPHVLRVTEASSTTAVCCIAGVFLLARELCLPVAARPLSYAFCFHCGSPGR